MLKAEWQWLYFKEEYAEVCEALQKLANNKDLFEQFVQERTARVREMTVVRNMS